MLCDEEARYGLNTSIHISLAGSCAIMHVLVLFVELAYITAPIVLKCRIAFYSIRLLNGLFGSVHSCCSRSEES